jgi:hypothetical protein
METKLKSLPGRLNLSSRCCRNIIKKKSFENHKNKARNFSEEEVKLHQNNVELFNLKDSSSFLFL